MPGGGGICSCIFERHTFVVSIPNFSPRLYYVEDEYELAILPSKKGHHQGERYGVSIILCS